jgi:TPR repeat protein
VAQNEEEALGWLETAAEAGHVRAQYLAEYLYLKRYSETYSQEDEAIGREWMELVAENGDEDAIRFLSELDEIQAAHDDNLNSDEQPPSESRQEKRDWSFDPVETA